MISKTLTRTMQHIHDTESLMARKAALVQLQNELIQAAPENACLRCNDAGFFITWQVPEGASRGSDKQWIPILGRCAKLMNLASHPHGGLAMCQSNYCSEMSRAEQNGNN